MRRIGSLVLIAAPVVVAALLLRPRGDATRPSPPAVIDDRAMLDSLRAADAKGDWVRAVYWSERLIAGYPRDHGVLLARGTAWSNYAVAQRPGRVLPRPALRTSLERIECMRRALMSMDSSGMVASNAAKWADSMERLAQVEETMGLPGDALIVYEMVKQRVPDDMKSALRAYWLRALLYDPVHPDTSEWFRQMRRLGRR